MWRSYNPPLLKYVTFLSQTFFYLLFEKVVVLQNFNVNSEDQQKQGEQSVYVI